jgi:hypothetical protein
MHPDDSQEALWYIRPIFIKHNEASTSKKTYDTVYIRWLCFARVYKNALSLHWRGFSYLPLEGGSEEETTSGNNTQFGYWRYIPHLFQEIEGRLGAQVVDINLERIILHRMWDTYLNHEGYDWNHQHIRAESSGVSINARASVLQLKGKGISHLALTIRKAVAKELGDKHDYTLLEPEHYDDIILRTIIREYGARSYEFILKRESSLLFRAHSYFGQRTEKPSQDSFPHLRIKQLHELKQLEFLLAHAQ